MLEEGSTVKFKNYKDVVHKPFVIWADFESTMVKVRIKKGEKLRWPTGVTTHTKSITEHKVKNMIQN